MTIQEQYENLEKTVRGYNPAADFQHIRAAFEFAAEAHKDQKRKSGEPYIIHPLAVAQIVAEELRLDSESIEAALLHDVIEDTAATHEQVSKLFSPTIADLVEGVSKLTRIQYATKEGEQVEDLVQALVLVEHLPVDGVGMLHPAVDDVIDVQLLQPVVDLDLDAAHEVLVLLVLGLQLGDDFLVANGVQIF